MQENLLSNLRLFLLLSFTSHYEWRRNAAVLLRRRTSSQLPSYFEDMWLIFMHQMREGILWILKHRHNSLSIWTSLTINMIHSLLSQDKFKDAAALTERRVCHLLHDSHPGKDAARLESHRGSVKLVYSHVLMSSVISEGLDFLLSAEAHVPMCGRERWEYNSY